VFEEKPVIAYKIFINPLLDTLERNQLGAYLGIHYCGTPTVADDVTLISNDPYELQSDRFCFHLTFDATFSYQCLKKSQLSPVMPKVYKSRNNPVCQTRSKALRANTATYLGIERISTGNNRKELVQTRITTARRTVFALMGAGLHGLNGRLLLTYEIPF
jgi:hypothetical protein